MSISIGPCVYVNRAVCLSIGLCVNVNRAVCLCK